MGTLVFYNSPPLADASEAPWSLQIFWNGAALARVRVLRTREGSANTASSGAIILFVDVPQSHPGLVALTGQFGRPCSCRGGLSACEWVPDSRLPPVVDEQTLGWLISHGAVSLLDATMRCADFVQAQRVSDTIKRRARDSRREMDLAIQAVKRARVDEDDGFDEFDAVNSVFMQLHSPGSPCLNSLLLARRAPPGHLRQSG